MVALALLCIITSSTWSLGVDDIHMLRALELAELGRGFTSPNPCVGCVIVNDATGEIVGEGWHVKAGQDHAEVRALKQAGENAAGCTAYVSLEPCNHFGRTPPCTDALIKAGIKRVVAGMVDPDPRVSGGGLRYLEKNGVKVDTNVQESKCIEINRPFIFRVLNKRAYATCWIPDTMSNRRLSSVVKAVPVASPETDMLILGEEQVEQIMDELGGDRNTAVIDLFSTLPARLKVSIIPLRTRSKEDMSSLVALYRARARQSGIALPEVFYLDSEECPSIRAVLEMSLKLGSNAALLIAGSPTEVEARCLEGHCQHLKMDFDFTGEKGADGSAKNVQGLGEEPLQFTTLKETLRSISLERASDIAILQTRGMQKERPSDRNDDEVSTGLKLHRHLHVYSAHVWRT